MFIGSWFIGLIFGVCVFCGFVGGWFLVFWCSFAFSWLFRFGFVFRRVALFDIGGCL